MDEETRLKAREMLLRSRIYRFIALVFAALGLVMFLYLYFHRLDGDMMHALSKPGTVLVILLPFLPAAIMSWLAVRAENRFMALLEQLREPGKK